MLDCKTTINSSSPKTCFCLLSLMSCVCIICLESPDSTAKWRLYCCQNGLVHCQNGIPLSKRPHKEAPNEPEEQGKGNNEDHREYFILLPHQDEVMSRSKKRVTLGYSTSEVILPEESQSIVRVSNIRGGNVCEVEYPSGQKVLCLIPSKFKNAVWIRKGSAAIVEQPADQEYAGKVRTTIVHLLSFDHIKELKKLNKWPEEFLTESEKKSVSVVGDNEESGGKESGDESDSDDDLFVNPNRQVDSEEESEDEEDDA